MGGRALGAGAGRRRASGGVPAAGRRPGHEHGGERADRPLVARFRISLALALAEVGRTPAALAQLRAASPDVDVDGRPRLLAQRSLVLLHAGRLREAGEAADGAIAATVANGDRLTEARSLVNRGIVRLQAGQLAAAEADLRAAAALADALDQRLMAAAVLHDLALVYARRGEIPRALAAFADAAGRLEQLASPGRTLVNLERDRAECLAGRALGGGRRVVGPGRGAGRQLRQRRHRGRGRAAARRRTAPHRRDRRGTGRPSGHARPSVGRDGPAGRRTPSTWRSACARPTPRRRSTPATAGRPTASPAG